MPSVFEIMEKAQGQVAAKIRELLGESSYDQRIFTNEERRRRVDAMRTCAEHQTSDEERHASWLQMHLDGGWVYGAEFDPARKTHPNLLPWDQLPAETRIKAQVFAILANAASEIERSLGVSP